MVSSNSSSLNTIKPKKRNSYILSVLEKRGLSGYFTNDELLEFEDLIMPVDTSIQISSVILSEDNKEKLSEFLAEQDNKAKLISHKLYPMNRLLFYGASGTGKTFLAKALSNYLGYTMLYVDIARTLSDNSVAKNISNVFKLADTLGQCVIFFDEADSIAWNRDSGTPEGGVARRATNSLFQYLDQMNPENVFISATNMLHRLDPAFERRFNMKFEFRKPKDIDYAIHKFLYPEFKIIDDVDPDRKNIITKRAEASPKLSYYELQGIVERAMKKSVMQDKYVVPASVIYDDIARSEGIKMYFRSDEDSKQQN